MTITKKQEDLIISIYNKDNRFFSKQVELNLYNKGILYKDNHGRRILNRYNKDVKIIINKMIIKKLKTNYNFSVWSNDKLVKYLNKKENYMLLKNFAILNKEEIKRERTDDTFICIFKGNYLIGLVRVFNYTQFVKTLYLNNYPIKIISYIDIHKKFRGKNISKGLLSYTGNYLNRKNNVIITTEMTELGEKCNIHDSMKKYIINEFYTGRYDLMKNVDIDRIIEK